MMQERREVSEQRSNGVKRSLTDALKRGSSVYENNIDTESVGVMSIGENGNQLVEWSKRSN